MHESNQGPAEEDTPPAPGSEDAEASGEEATAPASESEPHEGSGPSDSLRAMVEERNAPLASAPPILRGLWIWFVLIAALGLGGVILGQAELALSVALAGAFVAAQAADRDSRFGRLHQLITGIFVAGGAATFAALAIWLSTQSAAGPLRPWAVGIAGGGAVVCLLTGLRPFSDGLAAAIFRTTQTTRSLRLGARVVLMVLLFMFPGWVATPGIIDALSNSSEPLLDTGQLLGSLIGLTVLALGAVGFLVRLGPGETFARLGLRVPRPAHYGVALLGIAALYLLNVGGESVQREWFRALWESDQRINHLLAGGLGVSGGVLLGVSAGVGEELAMRGALQPPLGVVLTSLVFAGLHVHYSWFGMATIFLLGIILGLIRNRTSTTVAILVHALYDIVAVLTAGGTEGLSGR
jgi:CAAX prenyl protease-like protein